MLITTNIQPWPGMEGALWEGIQEARNWRLSNHVEQLLFYLVVPSSFRKFRFIDILIIKH